MKINISLNNFWNYVMTDPLVKAERGYAKKKRCRNEMITTSQNVKFLQ